MAKAKSIYSCTECGGQVLKWQGQCPHCQAWNTLVEAVAEAGAGCVLRGDRAGALAVRAAALEMLCEPRFAQSARKVSEWFERYPCGPRFVDALRALA